MSSFYSTPPTPDEIYHYGVLGMKWGVRRYQNPDGTLTEAGKRHYNREANRKIKKERKEASKNRRSLSDEEIQQRINRLNLEKKMKDLTDEDTRPGKTAVNNAFSKAGKVVMTAAVVGGLAYAGKLAIQHQIPTRAIKAVVRVAKASSPEWQIKEIKDTAKGIFNAERVSDAFKKIDWEELSRWMFPNPFKKK